MLLVTRCIEEPSADRGVLRGALWPHPAEGAAAREDPRTQKDKHLRNLGEPGMQSHQAGMERKPVTKKLCLFAFVVSIL